MSAKGKSGLDVTLVHDRKEKKQRKKESAPAKVGIKKKIAKHKQKIAQNLYSDHCLDQRKEKQSRKEGDTTLHTEP